MHIEISPRWFFQIMTLEMRKRIQYRFDFWVSTVGIAVGQLCIAIAVWGAVFREARVDHVGGYALHEMVFYYLLASVLTTALMPPFAVFAEEIYRGEATRYLLYPIEVYPYRLATYVGKVLVTTLQAGAAIGLFFLLVAPTRTLPIQLGAILPGIVAVAVAGLLIFTTAYCIELLAFWIDEVWALLVIQSFTAHALGGILFPLPLLPAPWEEILRVLPFAGIYSFPIDTLLGRISGIQWFGYLLVYVAWLVLIVVGAHRLWERGRLRYTGVGL